MQQVLAALGMDRVLVIQILIQIIQVLEGHVFEIGYRIVTAMRCEVVGIVDDAHVFDEASALVER